MPTRIRTNTMEIMRIPKANTTRQMCCLPSGFVGHCTPSKVRSLQAKVVYQWPKTKSYI
ncbi:hypothetical protein D910_04286 [Dendroctonus ponderosae]|uniref:Uncharacterized protein n=1 Tax=Dendroctonus ponderosae TaxID=77166 RepID=U4U3J5_DENPD|nr:hypothetical protein D910_04286 [Dendroctonus ponderosae]